MILLMNIVKVEVLFKKQKKKIQLKKKMKKSKTMILKLL